MVDQKRQAIRSIIFQTSLDPMDPNDPLSDASEKKTINSQQPAPFASEKRPQVVVTLPQLQ